MTQLRKSLTFAMQFSVLSLIALIIVIALPVGADEPSTMEPTPAFLRGKADFKLHCASCHGIRGGGDGAVSRFLTIQTPDLTVLSQANLGVFPKDRVYKVIDGRIDLMVHGGRTMPVWGHVFRETDRQDTNSDLKQQNRDIVGRIDDLVSYIQSIQD